MAKTKFKVDIHKTGTANIALLTAIANHNAGEVPVSLVDLQSYIQVQKSFLPYSNSGYYATRDTESESILYISEDGATNQRKLPAGTARIYDYKTDDGVKGIGTQFSIKYAAVPGAPTGWAAIEAEYE